MRINALHGKHYYVRVDFGLRCKRWPIEDENWLRKKSYAELRNKSATENLN